MVVGGVAVVLYGFLRLTVDLDLIVHLEKNNLDIFVHEPIRFEELYKARKVFTVEGVKIPVASLITSQKA